MLSNNISTFIPLRKKFSLICILLVLNNFGNAQESKKDYFAEIGNKIQNERFELLEEKKPPILPEILLPLIRGNSNSFTPKAEMNTREELYTELETAKNQFLPFLKNLAPEMGIYQDCYIEARNPIHFNDVFVRPLFDEEAVEVRSPTMYFIKQANT